MTVLLNVLHKKNSDFYSLFFKEERVTRTAAAYTDKYSTTC